MNLRRVKGILACHLYTLRHSPPAWFDMLFRPFMDLLLWGLVTSFIIRQGIEVPLPVGFLLGGVLLWDLMFRSANGVGVAFLQDTSWSHNILNLLVSPLKATEYLAGIVSFALSKVIFGWIVMIGLAWLLFSFSILEVGLPLAMFMLALLIFGVAVSMVIIGIALRFGPGADILAWGLVWMLMPVSAVYYPVEVLPGWLEAVRAPFLPPTSSSQCGPC